MDSHAQAIAILQNARDALAARLTQRVIEAQQEIEDDAEGGTYFSEIEAIYDQLGGRLAHLNAMLSNLPPAPAQSYSDTTASEIVYADLAASPSSTLDPTSTLDPSSMLDIDATNPLTLLALPAPAHSEETPPHGEEPQSETAAEPMVEVFAGIVLSAQAGDLTGAARLISEIFDVRPSLARRGAQAFARQLERYPDLGRRFEQLGSAIAETNEYAAATLLGECFEFQAIDSLLLVRALKNQQRTDTTD